MNQNTQHTPDLSHLDALKVRLANEKVRLHAAKTPAEIASRKAIVAGIEKEIAGEYDFLGGKLSEAIENMTADELLAAIEGR